MPYFSPTSNYQQQISGDIILLAQVSGNPIDALWSLIDKLHTWNRIYKISHDGISYPGGKTEDELAAHARIVGAVLARFEELMGSKADSNYCQQVIDNLGAWHDDNWQHWEEAAFEAL